MWQNKDFRFVKCDTEKNATRVATFFIIRKEVWWSFHNGWYDFVHWQWQCVITQSNIYFAKLWQDKATSMKISWLISGNLDLGITKYFFQYQLSAKLTAVICITADWKYSFPYRRFISYLRAKRNDISCRWQVKSFLLLYHACDIVFERTCLCINIWRHETTYYIYI